MARRRAAAAKRRASRRAKSKAMKLKCRKKGGKMRRGRCMAMQKRYRFSKFCKKAREVKFAESLDPADVVKLRTRRIEESAEEST